MHVVILEGDGIGPEIVRPAAPLFDVLNRRFNARLSWETCPSGLSAHRRLGTTFPDAVMETCRLADGIVLGPLSTSDYPGLGEGGVNASAKLRLELDLFANIRPCRAISDDADGAECDLVVVRENTEGFYAVRTMHAGSGEFAPDPQSAFALRKTTRKACERIARRAFEIARRRRGKVTAVHKVNVLVLTDGLFLEACRSAAGDHPDVVYEEELVDACAAHLVRAPGDYDVIVTTNLFGDILSNEAAQVAGSLGLAASLNHGANHGLAQAAHGSAPDIAGQDKANPASMLNSLVLLLSWMGEVDGDASLIDGARVLETVVRDVLGCASFRPPDMGGVAGTSAIQAEILRRVERLGLA